MHELHARLLMALIKWHDIGLWHPDFCQDTDKTEVHALDELLVIVVEANEVPTQVEVSQAIGKQLLRLSRNG